MKIIAQMDDISTFNINTDSTFAMLVAAQNRGHQIHYYLPSTLAFDNDQVLALVHQINVQNQVGNHYHIIDSKYYNLAEADLILFRQDPPFDMNYITTSYLLEKISNKVLIINDPVAIRNCPEKIFITTFPELMPPTLIASSFSQLENFYNREKNIVIKPLYGAGGEGVFHVDEKSNNLKVIFETMMKLYQVPFVAQKYLPEVVNGDKRILLLDGEPIGAVSRMAKSGEIRSNFHAGGVAKKAGLNDFEIQACHKIGRQLKKRGLIFAGIDVIGNYVTEINVTSPTGIKEINRLNQIQIEDLVIECFEKKVAQFKKKQ